MNGARLILSQNHYRVVVPDGKTYPERATKRGRVRAFSKASRVRLLERAAVMDGPRFRYLITLTYRRVMQDGRQAKRNLRAFVKSLLRWDSGCGVLWVAEFQNRGSLHFHLWLAPSGDVMYGDLNALRDAVRDWWHSVSGNDEKARHIATSVELVRKPHAVTAYALKYGAKESQKKLPDGVVGIGRWWGFSGQVPTIEQGTITDRAIVGGFASGLTEKGFLYRFRVFTSDEERRRVFEMVAELSQSRRKGLTIRRGAPSRSE